MATLRRHLLAALRGHKQGGGAGEEQASHVLRRQIQSQNVAHAILKWPTHTQHTGGLWYACYVSSCGLELWLSHCVGVLVYMFMVLLYMPTRCTVQLKHANAQCVMCVCAGIDGHLLWFSPLKKSAAFSYSSTACRDGGRNWGGWRGSEGKGDREEGEMDKGGRCKQLVYIAHQGHSSNNCRKCSVTVKPCSPITLLKYHPQIHLQYPSIPCQHS